MIKNIKKYPCDVSVGDHIVTRDGRDRVLKAIEGKYLLFEDGVRFSKKHPDIVGVKEIPVVIMPEIEVVTTKEPEQIVVPEVPAEAEVSAEEFAPKKRGRKPSVKQDAEIDETEDPFLTDKAE